MSGDLPISEVLKLIKRRAKEKKAANIYEKTQAIKKSTKTVCRKEMICVLLTVEFQLAENIRQIGISILI